MYPFTPLAGDSTPSSGEIVSTTDISHNETKTLPSVDENPIVSKIGRTVVAINLTGVPHAKKLDRFLRLFGPTLAVRVSIAHARIHKEFLNPTDIDVAIKASGLEKLLEMLTKTGLSQPWQRFSDRAVTTDVDEVIDDYVRILGAALIRGPDKQLNTKMLDLLSDYAVELIGLTSAQDNNDTTEPNEDVTIVPQMDRVDEHMDNKHDDDVILAARFGVHAEDMCRDEKKAEIPVDDEQLSRFKLFYNNYIKKPFEAFRKKLAEYFSTVITVKNKVVETLKSTMAAGVKSGLAFLLQNLGLDGFADKLNGILQPILSGIVKGIRTIDDAVHSASRVLFVLSSLYFINALLGKGLAALDALFKGANLVASFLSPLLAMMFNGSSIALSPVGFILDMVKKCIWSDSELRGMDVFHDATAFGSSFIQPQATTPADAVGGLMSLLIANLLSPHKMGSMEQLAFVLKNVKPLFNGVDVVGKSLIGTITLIPEVLAHFWNRDEVFEVNGIPGIDNETIRDMYATVRTLEINGSTALKDVIFCRKVVKAYTMVNDLRILVSKNKSNTGYKYMLDVCFHTLAQFVEAARSSTAPTTRPTPVGVWIWGAPGIGKSTLLPSTIGSVFGESIQGFDPVVPLNLQESFFSTWKPSSRGILIDDLDPTSLTSEHVETLKTMLSNVQYVPAKASLAEKGNCLFEPEVFFVNSNFPIGTNIPTISQANQTALYRRFYGFHFRISKDVQDAHGQLDPGKINADRNGREPLYYLTIDLHVRNDNKPIAHLTYYEYISFLSYVIKANRTEFENRMRDGKMPVMEPSDSVGHGVMCRLCRATGRVAPRGQPEVVADWNLREHLKHVEEKKQPLFQNRHGHFHEAKEQKQPAVENTLTQAEVLQVLRQLVELRTQGDRGQKLTLALKPSANKPKKKTTNSDAAKRRIAMKAITSKSFKEVLLSASVGIPPVVLHNTYGTLEPEEEYAGQTVLSGRSGPSSSASGGEDFVELVREDDEKADTVPSIPNVSHISSAEATEVAPPPVHVMEFKSIVEWDLPFFESKVDFCSGDMAEKMARIEQIKVSDVNDPVEYYRYFSPKYTMGRRSYFDGPVTIYGPLPLVAPEDVDAAYELIKYLYDGSLPQKEHYTKKIWNALILLMLRHLHETGEGKECTMLEFTYENLKLDQYKHYDLSVYYPSIYRALALLSESKVPGLEDALLNFSKGNLRAGFLDLYITECARREAVFAFADPCNHSYIRSVPARNWTPDSNEDLLRAAEEGKTLRAWVSNLMTARSLGISPQTWEAIVAATKVVTKAAACFGVGWVYATVLRRLTARYIAPPPEEKAVIDAARELREQGKARGNYPDGQKQTKRSKAHRMNKLAYHNTHYERADISQNGADGYSALAMKNVRPIVTDEGKAWGFALDKNKILVNAHMCRVYEPTFKISVDGKLSEIDKEAWTYYTDKYCDLIIIKLDYEIGGDGLKYVAVSSHTHNILADAKVASPAKTEYATRVPLVEEPTWRAYEVKSGRVFDYAITWQYGVKSAGDCGSLLLNDANPSETRPVVGFHTFSAFFTSSNTASGHAISLDYEHLKEAMDRFDNLLHFHVVVNETRIEPELVPVNCDPVAFVTHPASGRAPPSRIARVPGLVGFPEAEDVATRFAPAFMGHTHAENCALLLSIARKRPRNLLYCTMPLPCPGRLIK